MNHIKCLNEKKQLLDIVIFRKLQRSSQQWFQSKTCLTPRSLGSAAMGRQQEGLARLLTNRRSVISACFIFLIIICKGNKEKPHLFARGGHTFLACKLLLQ